MLIHFPYQDPGTAVFLVVIKINPERRQAVSTPSLSVCRSCCRLSLLLLKYFSSRSNDANSNRGKDTVFPKDQDEEAITRKGREQSRAEQSTVNSVSSAHRCKLEVLTDSYQKRLTFSYQWYA